MVALVLLTPFLGALTTIFLAKAYQKYVSLIYGFVAFLLTGYFAFTFQKVNRYAVSGWKAPLGINLHIDGLSVVMLLLTSTVAGAIVVYSQQYFKGSKGSLSASGFWPLLFFLWGSLHVLFTVSDLFTVYVCLELITLASVALITLANDAEALKAALRYLMTALVGSMFYLLGVALVYGRAGSLDWTFLSQTLDNDVVTWTAMSLMTAGLLIKAALFPLHFWLPRAHSIAPAPVSALLSALVVKASFFVVLRIWIQVFSINEIAVHVLGALGAGAIIWGSLQAIIQERIKLMVAYSTVAQLGYLFLVFPLLSAARTSTSFTEINAIWEGTIYFTLSHGIAKSAMFLTAGIIIHAMGSDRLRDIHGAAGRIPVAILTWGIAGISLIGLPPSGGFIAKWHLLTAAIRFQQWFYAAVILFGGLLASGYVFRLLWYAFQAPAKTISVQKVPSSMQAATLFLGILIVILGIRTTDISSLLLIGYPFFQGGQP